MLKAGAGKRFPARVGQWAKSSASGEATIYNYNGRLISVGFLSGSNYDTIVTNIAHRKTRAGTGYCGSTTEPTNLTCYLKGADGVLNLSADSGDVPLAQLVTFTNQLTATLGTS